MTRISTLAAAAMAALGSSTATAQATAGAPPARLPEVVVTGNPLGSELFELAAPVSTIGGTELLFRRSSTLGETLSHVPGVASSYFGPNASRPVIRGLDGDRVRILQNGAGVLDASAASVDHAVAVDPLAVERVEVVRGPAALLYGGAAVGGVVNVIDNRIPREAVRGIGGALEARLTGGGDRARAGSAMFEAGNGRFALHADAYARETDDLKIPGFARSARLRAAGPPEGGVEPHGILPNSAARANGGALGGSLTWDGGHAGLAYSGTDNRYGTVAEPTVVIDMRSTRWDFGGETRLRGGPLEQVKFRAGHTDYEHQEIDAGVVGTTFRNRGYDARLEAVHAPIGPLHGAIGVHVTQFDFSALGAEAFVPQTDNRSHALFAFEELTLGSLKLSFGARGERVEVSSAGGGAIDASTGAPKFGAAGSRTFSPFSGAVGAVQSFGAGLSFAANAAWTERAPTFQELYANGPHAATGAYEVGNRAFGIERSTAIDLALRWRKGTTSASVGAFRNRFDNYLALASSGNSRGADGELNPVDGDNDGVADGSGEEILPELVYRAVPALFRGVELQGRTRLLDGSAKLDIDGRVDYLRATDRATGQPLPRIAPLRIGVGLDWRLDRVGARLDVTHARAQDRVAAGELPTDGYTLVAVTLSWRPRTVQGRWEIFARADNLLDEEARNHVSFLKDIAPLAGRSLTVGLRGDF